MNAIRGGIVVFVYICVKSIRRNDIRIYFVLVQQHASVIATRGEMGSDEGMHS